MNGTLGCVDAHVTPTLHEAKTLNPAFPGIQYLRGAAALAVTAHHMLQHSNQVPGRFSPDWLTALGQAGVDVFFVISGFIMLTVSFPPGRPPARPLRFLKRRVLRIYPFYWLCCALMLVIGGRGLGACGVVSSILLLPNGKELIFVAWTLVYEMYFYLIFATTLRRGSMLGSAVDTTGFIALAFMFGRYLPWLGTFFGNLLPLEFCFGLWLGVAFYRAPGWKIPPAAAWLGVALMAGALLFVQHRHGHAGPVHLPAPSGPPPLSQQLFRVSAWGLPALLIVASCLRLGPPRGPLSRLLHLAGDASYAIYLLQVFSLLAYDWLLFHTALGQMLQAFIVPLAVLATGALGILAHLTVERPLISALRQRSKRSLF